MAVLDKLLRVGEGKKVKALQGLVPDINALEPELQKLSDDDLRAKTGEFRQKLDNGADLTDLLIEAFAVVREASSRTIGQRHYDVQMMGGAALHYGWVAEMKTGEGKTLVSTLPVYLNGLTGRGLHVITVNDYLATRDAEWMGQIHGWLGLSIGSTLVQHFFPWLLGKIGLESLADAERKLLLLFPWDHAHKLISRDLMTLLSGVLGLLLIAAFGYGSALYVVRRRDV